MTLLSRALTVLLLAFLSTLAAGAKSLHGVVSHVTDGDTIWIRVSGGAPVQVRIQGLDAPEICQAFGREARDALAARVLHRTVQVSTRARDSYQRSVGHVSVDGQDVGAWLVEHGFAWSARYRGDEGPYGRAEAQAREGRVGLWAREAVEPRNFRRRNGSCRPD